MRTINLLRELNIKVIEDYFEKLDIDYIFVPIEDENSIKVKLNDKVLKGQIVYEDKNIVRHSSVSGSVIKISKLNNKTYLIIKNDYQELSVSKRARNLDNINKELFLKYYTNQDIKDILNNKIINAIDDDVYTYNKYTYLKNNISDVGNIISLLKKIFDINNVSIVIKNSYSNLLNNYKYNVNYIKLDDIYPIGNKYLINKYLLKNDNDYVIDLKDIIDMIYEVKKNKVRVEKYITIAGDNIENKVLKVKKYSLLSNILDSKNKSVILNNSLCGKVIKFKDAIILDDSEAFIFNKDKNYIVSECSNCGLCMNVCPVKINPLIKSEKCIKCGLCNYVCPSNINIYERIQNNE